MSTPRTLSDSPNPRRKFPAFAKRVYLKDAPADLLSKPSQLYPEVQLVFQE